MASSCAVCVHLDRAAIDTALIAGERLNTVAARFGISKFSVGRHRSRHLVATTPITTGADDTDEINRWLARAEEIYAIACVDSDSRGKVSALTAALKSLEMRAKSREREAEAASTELSHDPRQWTEKQTTDFWNFVDSTIRAGERLPHAEDVYGVLLSEHHAPDLHQIFLRLQERPDWMRQVKEFCAELFAGEHEHDYESVSQQVAN